MDGKNLEELAQTLVRLGFVERDPRALAPYLDPQLSLIGPGAGGICRGAKAARSWALEAQSFPGMLTVENEEYSVQKLGKQAACVTARMTLQPLGECGAAAAGRPLRLSMVFALRAGGWKLVHLHQSAPGPAPGAAGGGELSRQEVLKLLEAGREEAYRHDALTGIYNMEGFAKKADELRRANPGRRYAFLKLGVNNFRYINQVCGFDTGDEVLRDIGRSLCGFCRPCEACGRVEKDIFAAMLSYKGTEELAGRMERLRQRLLSPQIKKRLGSEVSFTAGVYLPEDLQKEPVKDMLDKALIALESRQGERRGDKLVYYRPAMSRQRFEEGRLMEQAARALAGGGFQLYLQPQLALATGELAGGEALVRWQRPEGALLLPDQFIPLFEQSDFILKFDFYMLELLCRQLRAWLDAGLAVKPVSINQSRRHLNEPDYLARFCAVVDRYALPHRYIVFELTEGAFVEFGSETMALARQLHQRGFLLAIDDFGTGYASLHSVSRMAADVLKIDRSLLENFETNRRTRVILQKVVEMARETQMLSVCEGVETPAQEAYLKELGCDWVQGFLYARPMPAGEFAQKYLGEGRL